MSNLKPVLTAEPEPVDPRVWYLQIEAPGVRDRVTVRPFWDDDVKRLLVRVNGQLWGYTLPCEVIVRAACKPHHGLPAVDRPTVRVSCLRCGLNVYECPCAGYCRAAEARECKARETTERTQNWRQFPRKSQ